MDIKYPAEMNQNLLDFFCADKDKDEFILVLSSFII